MQSNSTDLAKLLNERIQRHEDGTVERWRDVPGFEEKYRVSDRGRVKSLARTTIDKHGVHRKIPTKIMKATPQKVDRPSLTVGLRKDDQYHYFLVHRLVLFAFVGPCPEGMEACHFPDRNPSNNNLSNLRWDTPKSNQGDRVIHKTDNRGIRNPRVRFTEAQILEIRRLCAEKKLTQTQIAEMFGTKQSTINSIYMRYNWKHI
jgi:NUMOD4 motif/HNH endonuclease